MPSQQIQLSDLVQQLSGLVVLASCVAMAMPNRKPKLALLPAVEPDKPAQSKPRKKNNSSTDVQEFMQLPPHIQHQVLNYAKNWLSANFERVD